MKDSKLEARIRRFPGVAIALAKLPPNDVKPLSSLLYIAETLMRDKALPLAFPGAVSPSRVPLQELRSVRRKALDLAAKIESLEKAHIPPGYVFLLGKDDISRGQTRTWEGFAYQLRGYAEYLYQEIRIRSSKRFPRLEDALVCEFVASNEDLDPRSREEKHWRRLPELAVLLSAAFAAAGSKRRFKRGSLAKFLYRNKSLLADACDHRAGILGSPR
jgi:hypothetical protein